MSSKFRTVPHECYSINGESEVLNQEIIEIRDLQNSTYMSIVQSHQIRRQNNKVDYYSESDVPRKIIANPETG
jgi:hypothetical protein